LVGSRWLAATPCVGRLCAGQQTRHKATLLDVECTHIGPWLLSRCLSVRPPTVHHRNLTRSLSVHSSLSGPARCSATNSTSGPVPDCESMSPKPHQHASRGNPVTRHSGTKPLAGSPAANGLLCCCDRVEQSEACAAVAPLARTWLASGSTDESFTLVPTCSRPLHVLELGSSPSWDSHYVRASFKSL
jgi:hypothetical protein